ncbi:excinuclease ABC subunit UvrC [Candidatus Saccharibacteria bacterium]|nr:excinuclease ABC subunit UvrC [Candidatus Saccharibacteria bacterium]
MNKKLEKKLKELPKTPGVYFHKNVAGEIIYVGKAAILKNRVRQYFQESRNRDPKTELLVQEIVDVDWQEVDSEIEALFLEAELIRRYMPRYNIMLRDDKAMSYVRINFKDKYPSVTLTRRPLDDKADYYGPFLSAFAVKKALKYLRRGFPYSTHNQLPKRACLQYHLGLCPGPETGELEEKEYKTNLKKLVRVLKGQRKTLMQEIEKEMKRLASESQFEKAAVLRNQLYSLKNLGQQVLFSDKEFQDISKDHALAEITELLSLKKPPRRIEGYDISHMSGTDTVASMVVFTNGASDKAKYRKFKSRIKGNDDFAHMNEVITRRFSQKNIEQWGKPDLLLIDGGKGQLQSALDTLHVKYSDIPVIGLAKKQEEIVIKNDWPAIKLNKKTILKLRGFSKETDDFTLVELPHSSNIVKLLQRIRDESHRFAVSYHSTLKTKRQTSSMLDDVPGIGPVLKKKLLKTFGSLKGVMNARQTELEQILGEKKAIVLRQYIRAEKKQAK